MTPAAALVTCGSGRLDGSESVNSAAARPQSVTKTGDSKARASGPRTSTQHQSEHRLAPRPGEGDRVGRAADAYACGSGARRARARGNLAARAALPLRSLSEKYR
jgi:hypothetical protein